MIIVMLFASAAIAGCGGGQSLAELDAGTDADTATDAATGADARPDDHIGDVQMPNCGFARTVCEGNSVYACVNRQTAELVETCSGSVCSLGRCTSAACASTEGTEGARGCRFYGAQVDNTDADDARQTLLLISNAGPQTATVRVETRDRDDDGRWTLPPMSDPVVVKPGTSARVRIWRPLMELGLIVGGAYRVDSDAPVMVVEIIGDDTERMSRSSGGTVLRPIQALGLRYLALTAPGENSMEVARTPGSRDGAGAITIIGTAPQTVVSLGVTAVVAARPGTNLQPRGEGEPPAEPFILNEGDVLQVFSVDSGGDLTGSTIDADVPVAVFSGNVFTSYGQKVTNSNGGDLVMEQLPPINSWNREYVGVRLSPQGTCESLFKGAGANVNASAWRVLATAPNGGSNMVELKAPPGVTFDIEGAPSGNSSFVLKHGMAQSFVARGTATVAPDFELMAREPVLLAQWLDCEPALSWGIDARLTGNTDLPFALPPGFETEMVVVRTLGETLNLDDTPVAKELFRRLSATSRLEVARLPAENLRCPDQWDGCQHRLSGGEFGVTWRGMDVVCSYALTVPSRARCALPNVTSCPD